MELGDMALANTRRALARPLKFGDAEQIEAYAHLERVVEIERVLEGDDSDAHNLAVQDAIIDSGWYALLREARG